MTVREFLKSKTYTDELCVIRDKRGQMVAAAFVDAEDLFLSSLSDRILNMRVYSYWYDTVIISDCYGVKQEVRVHCVKGEEI